MAITRHFLGWDSAVLPAAAAWLWERYGPNLGGVIVALPAARAGRRLLELLAERAEAERAILVPPDIETAGGLPERLYVHPSEADPGIVPVADETTALLARAASLRGADSAVLRRVIPHPPAGDDWAGWWRLADALASLSRELAAARTTPAWVVEQAEASQVDLGLGLPRWEALAELETAYETTLGRDDPQMARRRALKNFRTIGCDKDVVLAGLVDLSPQLAGLLGHLDNLSVLVPAPSQAAAGFDALGGLVVDYWQEQTVAVEDLRFVDRPRDQAAELVRCLSDLPEGTRAEAVSVGLGDETAGRSLERAIELAGTPARVAAGKSLRDAGPAVLLVILGRYAAQRRFVDMAELVRHPDLAAVLGEDESWTQRLDEYASQFMQAEVRGGWRGDETTQATLESLRQRIEALLPEAATKPRALSEWAGPIGDVLRRVYGERSLNRFTDHELVEALGQLGQALSHLAELGGAGDAQSALPRVDFATAVSFLLGRLAAGQLPAAADGPAVELLGFLELPWDDAEFVVLTDFNEGHVPDSRQADAWLPDGLRSAMGLPDNTRRYARDVLLLNIVLRSRPRATVLACRRAAEGDPRMPSRLLLACDQDTLIQRVTDFYPDDEAGAEAATAPVALLTPGGASRFLIPRPLLDHPVLEQLSATKFRDYLACPYRFYLKHVERLRPMDDRAVEMNAAAFGNLAHEVLAGFARSSAADAAEPRTIADWCVHELARRAHQRYGPSPNAAVRVQLEMLRQRLAVFAHKQAQEAQAGWRIVPDAVERQVEHAVIIDGQPFTITGTIDRADHHPQHGYRVVDYKTRDASNPRSLTPEAVHRQKKSAWVDLQLPLYRTLAAAVGIDDAAVGYFNLGRAEATTGLEMAEWDAADFASAERTRDLVIRQVREQKFWPPKQPPPFADGLSRLAADAAIDRDILIGGVT